MPTRTGGSSANQSLKSDLGVQGEKNSQIAREKGYLMGYLPPAGERGPSQIVKQAVDFVNANYGEVKPYSKEELVKIAKAFYKPDQDDFEAGVTGYRYPEAYGGAIQDARKAAKAILDGTKGVVNANAEFQTVAGGPAVFGYKEIGSAIDKIFDIVRQTRNNANSIIDAVKSSEQGKVEPVTTRMPNREARTRANYLRDSVADFNSGVDGYDKNGGISYKKAELAKLFAYTGQDRKPSSY